MKIKTLSITAAVLASAIMIIAVTAGCREKNTEEPVAETERIETVQETAPQETTTALEETTAKIEDHTSEPSTTETLPEEPETTLSAEELAQMVIDAGINGDARKAELGERYDEVQAWIDENYVPPVQTYSEPVAGDIYVPSSGDALTPGAGVVYYKGHMETYYNLPMRGVLDIMYSLGYSGEYWVRADGVKMFGSYVMVAADFGWLPRGSIVETSLGTGIVCDTGAGGWYWCDIATTW